MDAVLATNSFLIIATGDFNAKSSNWYTGDTTNLEGSKTEAITSQFALQKIINGPTYIQGKFVSCIDLIFSSQPNLVMSSGIHSSLHQNCHHQIFAKFNLKVHYPPLYEREVVGNKAKGRISKRVFFGKFDVLCFLETPVLRFVLLPCY